MEGSVNQLVQTVIQNTKCGASVWATFRFFSNLLYAFCWIVALPVELVLNRRMGRRYSGVLPLIGSATLLVAFFWLFTTPLTKSTPVSLPPAVLAALQQSSNTRDAFIVLLLLSVGRHRLASWWRFQSQDQVHSFSNGVPFYLCPPRALMRLLPINSPPAEVAGLDWSNRVRALRGDQGAILRFGIDVIRHLWQHCLVYAREWRSGEVPTGPIAWIASTVLHPLLLIILAATFSRANVMVSFFCINAGFAIFLKARIQKAMVVEAVYDVFDARIEQEFTRSLSNPKALQRVERAGFAVPGMAKAVVGLPQTIEAKPAMPTDLAALVTATEGGGDGPTGGVDRHASHNAGTNHQVPHGTPHQDARP